MGVARVLSIASSFYVIVLLTILLACREVKLDTGTYSILMAALAAPLIPVDSLSAVVSACIASASLAYYVRAAPCPRLDLRGRVCVVTGTAGKGMGRFIALGLAKMGATVVVTAQTEDEARAVSMQLRRVAGHNEIFPEVMDLRNREEVQRCALALCDHFPVIDMVINNAGVMQKGGRCSLYGVDDVVATNYVGPYLFTRLLMPRLLQSESPVVVNVGSSTHSFAKKFDFSLLPGGKCRAPAPRNLLAPYAQSKLGMLLFTAGLRANHPSVRAVAVHPGFVHTHITRNFAQPVCQLYRWLAPLLVGIHRRPAEGAATVLRAATLPFDRKHPGTLYYTPTGCRDYPECARSQEHVQKVWAATEQEVHEFLR
jgi:retinol dehydrogenase-12